MSISAQKWGVPTTGSTVPRTRLLDRLAKNPGQHCILVGPSGYGKTVLAAQYSNSLEDPVAWLSLDGSPFDVSRVFQQLIRLLGHQAAIGAISADDDRGMMDYAESAKGLLAASASRPITLVLDGCRTPNGGVIGDTVSLAVSALSPFVRRVVVTTRELSRADLLSLHGWTIIQKGDFIFDEAEALLLARELGAHITSDCELRDSVNASGGHAALLSMILVSRDARLTEHAAEPSVAATAVLERLIHAHLDDHERSVLELAALLKECTSQELERAGSTDAAVALKRIQRLLPLVRSTTSTADGHEVFVVHDLVRSCLLHQLCPADRCFGAVPMETVLGVLAERGNWSRAAEVLERLCDEEDALEFVRVNGPIMLSTLCYEELLKIIGLVALQRIMRSPKALLYWSSALHEAGRMSESLAKASAALTLAEHERDFETLGLAAASKVNTWVDQGKDQEAIDCAERYLGDVSVRMPSRVRCEVLLSYAVALAGTDRQEEALGALSSAAQEAKSDDPRYAAVRRKLERVRIFIETLWTGEWDYAARRIAPLLNDAADTYYVRQMLRGNLAVALVELGRLSRAESLLRIVTNHGHALLDAAYCPTLGLVAAARGDYGECARLIGTGRSAAVQCSDEADIHVSLVYQSVVERAAGDYENALETAERAFENLSHRDIYSYSRLAAIEIGASLLALGDRSASKNWVGPLSRQDVTNNRYYALCGAMVLAVIEHREGDTAAAVALLTPFAPYIRSESANWRMAMYCRTFPELLGLLSAAVGADNLPIHMLRMLLPENAERGLRDSHAFLSDEDWQALGRRALGEEQFTEYLERKGRPICRVRLFGGLEVNVEDRIVCERDWTKRKARLLFAMLVVRRGQDVPRDQILEHLWPELDDGKARNNFYVIWSTMKSALMGPAAKGADCPYVESKRGRCRIVREAVRSDVDEFEELIAAARHAESSGDTEGAKAALSELMNVYRGDLLPGDVYDDWFAALRDKYRLLFVDAMLKGVDLLLEQDNPCEAVLFARQGLNAEPHREDLYQAALKCYISAGQRSSAIEAFIQCKAHLAENIGLDPSAETLELYQQVLAMEERPRRDSYGLNAE